VAEAGRNLAPPSRWLLLAEGRALGELLTSSLAMPLLRRGPRGDGHPVMVLPGFLASGLSTRFMRSFLKQVGYNPHCWRMGRNLGPAPGLENRLLDRLRGLRRRYQRKVSLVGWSLGGVYSRLLANLDPEPVRSVITLGSPFNDNPKANQAWRLFEWVSSTEIEGLDPAMMDNVRRTPPVPTTAIYTEGDGVTAWQCCVDSGGPLSENIRVPGSHCGLGFNPLVLHAIADRLAQGEGEWRPFERSGVKSVLYPGVRKAEAALAEGEGEEQT
jgi:pimeloyl-ACP methyl ester carboxylesterase